MARAKYKIGTFVKTTDTEDQASHYGAVEEIHLTAAGTAYKLTGMDTPVAEADIEQGYRPIVTRTKVARTSTKRGKKSARADTQAAA